MAENIVLGTELSDAELEAVEDAFIDCFGGLYAPFCKDKARLARAFRGSLNRERMFAALEDGHIKGFLLYSNVDPPFAMHLVPETVKGEFGAVAGGLFAAIMNRAYCDRAKVKYANEVYIEFLGVVDYERGRGVGERLLARIHEEPCYDTWRLDVLGKNLAAQRLYNRMGYVTTGIKNGLFNRLMIGDRTVYMERGLPGENEYIDE